MRRGGGGESEGGGEGGPDLHHGVGVCGQPGVAATADLHRAEPLPDPVLHLQAQARVASTRLCWNRDGGPGVHHRARDKQTTATPDRDTRVEYIHDLKTGTHGSARGRIATEAGASIQIEKR